MNENKANDILLCPTCMRCHQTDYESRCLFSAKHVKKHCIDAFARLCEKYALGCRTIIRTVRNASVLLQRSSLPLMLVLLANDVQLNPGPSNPITAKPCKTNPSDLKVLYLNARSLKSFVPADNDTSNKVCKITLLQELVHGGEYEVVCVCENWLNNTILDTELLPGFNIFRRDRKGRIGGGVLIAIKENLHATRRCDLERDGIELAVVQLNKANNEPVILYVYYRPPNSSPDVGLSLLNNSIASNPESCCIILVGDFNIPSISWSESPSTPINTGGCSNGENFCELIGDIIFCISSLMAQPTVLEISLICCFVIVPKPCPTY